MNDKTELDLLDEIMGFASILNPNGYIEISQDECRSLYKKVEDLIKEVGRLLPVVAVSIALQERIKEVQETNKNLMRNIGR